MGDWGGRELGMGLKDQMQCFLVVKVKCLSSVFNYSQTHLNIVKRLR